MSTIENTRQDPSVSRQLAQPRRQGQLRGHPRGMLRRLERFDGQIQGHRLNWNKRMGKGQNLGLLLLGTKEIPGKRQFAFDREAVQFSTLKNYRGEAIGPTWCRAISIEPAVNQNLP